MVAIDGVIASMFTAAAALRLLKVFEECSRMSLTEAKRWLRWIRGGRGSIR
jgi:hypothetical protein